MIDKIAFSPKAKKYTSVMLCVSLVLALIAFIMPATLQTREVRIVGDKSQAVANTMSSVINSAYSKELDYVRSNTNTDTAQFKKLNQVLIDTAEITGCTRIFAVYKGVGGTYYNLLESYYPTDSIGKSVDDAYRSKYKSMWDRISNGKVYSDFSTSLLENELGKSVIAWSALKNADGDVIAVLGVQNSMSNKEFNKFSLGEIYVILVISLICFAVALTLFFIAIRIYRVYRKLNKGCDKGSFNNENNSAKPRKFLTSRDVTEQNKDNKEN